MLDFLKTILDEIDAFLVTEGPALGSEDRNYLQRVRICIEKVTTLRSGKELRGFTWVQPTDGSQKAHEWLEAKKKEHQGVGPQPKQSQNESSKSPRSILGKRRADASSEEATPRRTKKMYPLLDYHINRFLESLEGQPQSMEVKEAIFLLKEAIRLMSFGGHPRTMGHHLRRVKLLICEEDQASEDLLIVFNCLDYLHNMYT